MELPSLSVEEAKTLLEGDFGVEVVKLISNHLTFFTFGTVTSTGEADFKSATCFFLQTPLKCLLVTAKHVFEKYQRDREEKPDLRCQVGNSPFQPEKALIGMGDRTDIVTFEYPLDSIIKSKKYPISLWPPSPPDFSGTGIVHAGFPRLEMKMLGPRTGSFGLYTAIGASDLVTDRQIICDIVCEESGAISSIGPMPPPGLDTGGMSGGPMLSIREKNGVLSFPLAGVISEGWKERDRIIGERADSIRADGSVRG